MRGPLATLLGGLLIVAGLTGWGLWERHQGAVLQRQSDQKDSIIAVGKVRQDSIQRADSVKSAATRDSLESLKRALGASQARQRASQGHTDSLLTALGRDSAVLGDTLQQVIGAVQAERQAAQQTIANLQAQNALLERTLAGKDSTIAALNHSLDGERQQLATALRPHSPGILSRGFDLATKTLALYGLGKLVFH